MGFGINVLLPVLGRCLSTTPGSQLPMKTCHVFVMGGTVPPVYSTSATSHLSRPLTSTLTFRL